MKMKSRQLILYILIICLGSTFIHFPVQAANASAPVLATNPQPSKKSPIELRESSIQLNWYEERVDMKGGYRLVNPADKKITLTMQLQTNSALSAPLVTVVRKPHETSQQQPLLTTVYKKQVIETQYEKYRNRYLWEFTFAPKEELDLLMEYPISNDVTGDGLNIAGFSRPRTKLWGSDKEPCTVVINLVEIHPGLLSSIQPNTYKFTNNALVFSLPPPTDSAIDIRLGVI